MHKHDPFDKRDPFVIRAENERVHIAMWRTAMVIVPQLTIVGILLVNSSNNSVLLDAAAIIASMIGLQLVVAIWIHLLLKSNKQ